MNNFNNDNKILVEINKLNELVNYIGELVLTKNRLLNIIENLKLNNNELNDVSNRISIIATDIQNSLVKIRMIDLENFLDEIKKIIENKIQIKNKIQEEVKLDKKEEKILKKLFVQILQILLEMGIHEIEILVNKDNNYTLIELLYNVNYSVVDKIENNLLNELKNRNIEIKDEKNKLKIKIPNTLSILKTLLIKSNDSIFAFSLNNVLETLKLKTGDINYVEGKKVINIRQEIIPLYSIEELYEFKNNVNNKKSKDFIHVVIVKIQNKKVGIRVDEFLGEEEIVLKEFSECIENIKGLSGISISGEGEIILIINLEDLVNNIIIPKEKNE